MLNINNNRLDYGKELHPPEGYTLDFAIAATFTLDLSTLMTIPVALLQSRYLDEPLSENSKISERIDILDVLRKSSERIKVYCQKGKIKVPKTYNRSIAFLENSIAEVLPEKGGYRSSFHPKFWVARYTHPKREIVYRLLILSRNLTFDRSWDIAYRTDGIVSGLEKGQNEILCKSLKELDQKDPFPNSEVFISDLEKVRFSIPDGFDSQQFHYSGFESSLNNPLQKLIDSKQHIDNLLIISPFCDKSTLLKFKEIVKGNFFLFSRKHQLEQFSSATLDSISAYCVSNVFMDALSSESVEDSNIEYSTDQKMNGLAQKQDLHAKIYICEYRDQIRWFMGSTNATIAGFTRNQEMLVELTTSNNFFSVNNVKDNLVGDEDDPNLFDNFEPSENAEDQEEEIDLRRTVAEVLDFLDNGENIHVVYKANDDSTYDLTVSFTSIDVFNNSSISIDFKPYGYGGMYQSPSEKEQVFKGIDRLNVSKFFHWELKSDVTGKSVSFLTRFPIEDFPKDRIKWIVNDLVSNSQKFFQYLAFILGDDFNQAPLLKASDTRSKNGYSRTTYFWQTGSPIFEKLLKAASRNPEKLEEIDALLNELEENGNNEEIIKFRKFWEPFKVFCNNG